MRSRGLDVRVRALGWHLPTTGPKTINGLVVEHLEHLPRPGTSVQIDGYRIEISQARANAIRTVHIRAPDSHGETAPAQIQGARRHDR